MPRYSKYGTLDTVVADEGDVGFVSFNNRKRPDQLAQGELAESINGRMDLEAAWQVRKGLDSFGPTLTANTESIRLVDPPVWKLYGTVSISSASRSLTTITVTTSSAHNLSSSTLVSINGVSGTVDPTGNRLVTVTGPSAFTFTIAGATGSETYTLSSATVAAPKLSSTATTGVYGSCLFSDPSSNNANYIIRATNKEAVATPVGGGSSITISDPAGTTISSTVELLQCFDKVLLFREGLTALEWDGDLSGSPAFTAVASGVYAQPIYFDAEGNGSITDGVVTIVAVNHGLSVGDEVYVVDRAMSEMQEGDYAYTVSEVPSANSFRFLAQVPDVASDRFVISKRISSGKGFIHMPAPGWGYYHQRRLWLPYWYEPGAGGYTDRNRRDEIIASDILDSDTYDRLENQYRITAGIADYVVGFQAFAEDNLLVFNRNSIHLVRGISGAISDTTVTAITSEIGCVARRSILQVGNQVLFLSDNGVYAAAFGDLYNLRGAGVPLSEPIAGTIARINKDYAGNAVAAYFNNRYYLAVPLDSSTSNNALLIYNFMNQGWESVDEVRASGWAIDNLIVGENNGLASMFTISPLGSIHKVDAREDNNDRLSLFAGVPPAAYPIYSKLTTRQYSYGTMDRKKFSTYELHVESSTSQSSNAGVVIEVENPDSTTSVGYLSDLIGSFLDVGEDTSVRGRIGNKRGYGAQISIIPTAGRPKLRAVKLQASITDPTATSKT
jgi:hypothetical protein